MIEAYVDNLGKYVEGHPCGGWIKFPSSQEYVKALLAKIGVDGVLYEEIIITDYKTQIDGLYDYLGEFECLDELNYLASLLSDMYEPELEKFESAVALGEHIGCAQELINLAQNLDCYDLYPGVTDTEELGLWLIDEVECEKMPDWMASYFDYEGYGRDYSINNGGGFVYSGYIHRNDSDFKEHYKGRNVPDEYRVFAYPDPPSKMPMNKQFEMFSKMASSPAAEERLTPARDERG